MRKLNLKRCMKNIRRETYIGTIRGKPQKITYRKYFTDPSGPIPPSTLARLRVRYIYLLKICSLMSWESCYFFISMPGDWRTIGTIRGKTQKRTYRKYFSDPSAPIPIRANGIHRG